MLYRMNLRMTLDNIKEEKEEKKERSTRREYPVLKTPHPGPVPNPAQHGLT